MSFDISAIMTAHAEGSLAHASLRAFEAAVAHARSHGLAVECLVLLDTPTPETRRLFQARAAPDWTTHEVACLDQGLTRNHAIELSRGKYLAFLDADDLWIEPWLTLAHEFCERHGGRVIAHPEFNYFFEGQATVFEHLDSADPDFSLDMLRLANYWDALCFCARDIYRRFPFHKREISRGYAYEDWYWNCQTTGAGIAHKVIRDTVIFKRRRKDSQTVKAFHNKSLVRHHELSSYSSPAYMKEGAADA